jgi:hypothetical protein
MTLRIGGTYCGESPCIVQCDDQVPILQLKQEISNLQAQYDDLQCDNEIKVSAIAP